MTIRTVISAKSTITKKKYIQVVERKLTKCFVLFKFANDLGISPNSSIRSVCILSNLGRYTSSLGKDPVNWFSFKSLQAQNITNGKRKINIIIKNLILNSIKIKNPISKRRSKKPNLRKPKIEETSILRKR